MPLHGAARRLLEALAQLPTGALDLDELGDARRGVLRLELELERVDLGHEVAELYHWSGHKIPHFWIAWSSWVSAWMLRLMSSMSRFRLSFRLFAGERWRFREPADSTDVAES